MYTYVCMSICPSLYDELPGIQICVHLGLEKALNIG